MPDPAAVDLRRLRTTRLDSGTKFFTAYRRRHAPALFNDSGAGDTRFAPIHDRNGALVPTLYGARTKTVALLESAFHEVTPGGARVISEAVDLAPRGLAILGVPRSLPFIDLRDDALAALDVPRQGLVATLADHYCCTREWGQALHARPRVGGAAPVGLLWRSRQAELAQEASELFEDLLVGPASEVFILFGDRMPTGADHYDAIPVFDDLASPSARTLVEDIARQLRATIVAA